MTELWLPLPWPPSANNYWRKWNNRMVISPQARAYHQKVSYIAKEYGRMTADARLAVSMFAYPPDKRKRDIDNLVKITLDALEKGKVFENDSQVDFLSVQRKEVVKDGEMWVCVRSLNDT